MSSRRGILGGLAALGMGAGAGAAPRGAVAQQVSSVGSPIGGYAVGRGAEVLRPCADPLMKLFVDRMDREWARRRRLQARLDLTGGVPPGILACKSWKPWFAAAAIDRWREEVLPDPGVVERTVYRAVFGRDRDGG